MSEFIKQVGPIGPEKKESPLERISQAGHLAFYKIKSRLSF